MAEKTQKPPTRPEAWGAFTSAHRLTLAGLGRLGELGCNLEKVADHAVVGDLEDRRLFVLVNRDDRLRRLHAGAVLDGPGDPERDVGLRRDRLTGLADLELARVVARVHCGAGRA